MRLNPHYPPNFLFLQGAAYLNLDRYNEAVAALTTTITRKPDHLGAHLLLAIIYSGTGREKDAAAQLEEALRINPQLTVRGLSERLPALPDKAIAALRSAGLPD